MSIKRIRVWLSPVNSIEIEADNYECFFQNGVLVKTLFTKQNKVVALFGPKILGLEFLKDEPMY